ncbi:hypothetical protein SCB71_13760 [Herbiconiux sp. KACC 21604]|uniref:hypothetical protein n=1 Tax=unclassified Herbiconiux TaxID=2618217 RepID=UPI001C1265EC|nr:hypothetical protein [Herbiconiux sp. SALV-R1]WPO85277.1 hypothetical protein SCB71_13760 [Herbiconiux sp. KACC 21604]
MTLTRILAAAAIVVAAAGLSACTASSNTADTPDGGDVIAPVTMEANDLQGETVDLVVGQVLNINTGDLATDSYSGEVADTAVATFTKGGSDSSAEFNPGVEAVGVGETEVTMTNSDGGIQPLTFTVVVTEKK